MNTAKFAHTRSKSKKPLVLGLAALALAASLIGGAFAWTDFTQSRTNRFHGIYDADVSLHDEFDGLNKDVFVENSGTNTVYVRVRLDEFMKVGETQFDPAANVRDKTTWTTHTYGAYGGPTIEDCDHAAAGKFHDYYEWDMSGKQRNYYPGTPGMVYGTLDSNGEVDSTTGPNQTAATAAPVKLGEYITMKGIADAQIAAGNPVVMPSVTMQQKWARLTTTGCWILDDTQSAFNGGGWAYWSKPLEPGKATNLLLDEVKLLTDAEDDWIYRIDVKLQAVTLGDVLKWHDDASTCGYKLTPEVWALIHAWRA